MIERPLYMQQDHAALMDLWLADRIATSAEIYPTVWRLKLLLTSRVWEPALDTRIWETETSGIIAFAMLWRRQPQSPYLVLDYFIQPTAVIIDLFEAIIRWGIQRARMIVQEDQFSLTLFTSPRHNSIHSKERLEALGFKRRPQNEQGHNVYFARNLEIKLSEPWFPSGYTTRLLQCNDNLEAYSSVYDFAPVHPKHLEELLASEEYHHRVITDSQGRFVAYCEYSICRAEWKSSGRRLGWIDYIGTRAENQRQGLGSTLLISSLQHLKTQGAKTTMLVTVSTNTPAIGLYQQTGFKPIAVPEPPSFQIEISP